VVVKAGNAGDQGVLEISDIIFTTRGSSMIFHTYLRPSLIPYLAPGAIVLEWNIHDPSGQQGAAGL
jgi:glucan 1,3-beta-glucosidase